MKKEDGFAFVDFIMYLFVALILIFFIASNVIEQVNRSKKAKYIEEIKEYIDLAKKEIKDLPISKTEDTYYIPLSCITHSTKTGWNDAYVVVTYEKTEFHYYWTGLDKNGNFVPLVKEADLKIDVIEENSAQGVKKKSVGSSNKIYVLTEDCKLE